MWDLVKMYTSSASMLVHILLLEREVSSTFLVCSDINWPRSVPIFLWGFLLRTMLYSRKAWLHSETGEVEKEDAALAPLSYFLRARIKSELGGRLPPRLFTWVAHFCWALFLTATSKTNLCHISCVQISLKEGGWDRSMRRALKKNQRPRLRKCSLWGADMAADTPNPFLRLPLSRQIGNLEQIGCRRSTIAITKVHSIFVEKRKQR